MCLGQPYIDILPVELLVLIFTHVQTSLYEVPRVCRRWRSVALGAPSLWSDIIISTTFPAKLAALYIQRSGQTPLTLYAQLTTRFNNDDGGEEEDDYGAFVRKEVVEVVLSCADRWKSITISLHIDGHRSFETTPLRHFSHLRVPLLEKFTIALHARPTTSRFTDHITLFQLGAPKLTHLDMFATLSIMQCNVSVATPTITSFTLTIYAHYDNAQRALTELSLYLRQFPALTHLVLLHNQKICDANCPTIVLPNLLSLRIRSPTSGNLTRTLKALSVPKLQHLGLPFVSCDRSTISLDTESESASLRSFFIEHARQRTFVSLKSLDVSCSAITCKPWLLPMFEAFPNITSVLLRSQNATAVLRALCQDDQMTLWPKLRKLALGGLSLTADIPLLLDFLRVRAQKGVPITHLNIYTGRYHPLPTSVWGELKLLVSKLELVVSSRDSSWDMTADCTTA